MTACGPVQCAVLEKLLRVQEGPSPEPPNVAWLAACVGRPPSDVSGTVSRLQVLGLVTKTPDPERRSRKLVRLTQDGEEGAAALIRERLGPSGITVLNFAVQRRGVDWGSVTVRFGGTRGPAERVLRELEREGLLYVARRTMAGRVWRPTPLGRVVALEGRRR